MCMYKLGYDFAIIVVYVDDMNLFGTQDEIQKIAEYLKWEFKMKDLEKTSFDLKMKHRSDEILVYQKG